MSSLHFLKAFFAVIKPARALNKKGDQLLLLSRRFRNYIINMRLICSGEAKILSLFINDSLTGIPALEGTILLMLVTSSLYEDVFCVYCSSTESFHTS